MRSTRSPVLRSACRAALSSNTQTVTTYTDVTQDIVSIPIFMRTGREPLMCVTEWANMVHLSHHRKSPLARRPSIRRPHPQSNRLFRYRVYHSGMASRLFRATTRPASTSRLSTTTPPALADEPDEPRLLTWARSPSSPWAKRWATSARASDAPFGLPSTSCRFSPPRPTRPARPPGRRTTTSCS